MTVKKNYANRPSQSDRPKVKMEDGRVVPNAAYKPTTGDTKKKTNNDDIVAQADNVLERTPVGEINNEAYVTDDELIEWFGRETFDDNDFDDEGNMTIAAADSYTEIYRSEVDGELANFAEGWLAANAPDSDYLVVEGGPVSWMQRSGSKIITVEEFAENPSEAVSIGGDVTQRWSFDEDGSLTVIQSSHDVPTGGSFTIRPATSREEAIENGDDY